MSTSSQRYTSSFKRGFTLVELLVVVAIIAIVSSVILVQQSRFDSSTLLRSLAYSIALSVRQAQVYGSSVLGTTTASTNCVGGDYTAGTCYAAAYGIYLSSGSPSSYTLFADLNNNGAYNAGGAEDIKIFNLSTGYTVATACAENGSNWYCTASCPASLSSCTPTFFSALNVVFHYPNPDACFADGTHLCSSGSSSFYSNAYVEVSGGDNTRSITISQTGEISVGAAGS